MPWLELKIGAREQIQENSPRIFLVSSIYIILMTVMWQLIYKLPLATNAGELYLQYLTEGYLLSNASIGTILSFLRPSGIPFAFVLWLLTPVLDVGYANYCLKISRKQTGDHKDLFDGFLFSGKIVLIKIVTTVLVVLWSIPFFFPALAAYYRYRQAYYILLDDPKKSALQCIRESKHIMHGNKLDLFLLDLSFFGWVLLNSIVSLMFPLPFPLPLVSLWLTPYYGLTCAAYYNQLLKNITV